MKLKFQTKDIQKVLKVASTVVTGRSALPVLSNVLIETIGGSIYITATDLTLGIKALVPGEIVDPGSVTVPVKILHSIVNDLPGKEFVFETLSNDRVQVQSGGATFRLVSLPSDDFPVLPEIDDDFFVINANDLRRLIKKTVFAVSADESRQSLTGLSIRGTSAGLVVAATDGRRLAVIECATPYVTDVIVPLKAVKTVVSTFAGDEDIDVSVSNNQITFSNGAITLNSRLIEGEFPNYNIIMDPLKDNDIEVKAESEDIIAAVRRIALLSNPKHPHIIMKLEGPELSIAASTPELGDAKETLAVVADESVEIAFNWKFVLDVLNNMEGKHIVLKFKDALSPALVYSPGCEDYKCVLMPVKM